LGERARPPRSARRDAYFAGWPVHSKKSVRVPSDAVRDGQKLDDEDFPDSISTVISSPDFKP